MPRLNATASVIIISLTAIGMIIAACVLFAGANDPHVLSPLIEYYKAFLALVLGLALACIAGWAEGERIPASVKNRSGNNR